VTAILVTNGGTGYFAPTITIAGGGGSGAAAVALTDAAGKVTGVTVINGGSGYTSVPGVTIANAGGGGGVGAVLAAQIGGGPGGAGGAGGGSGNDPPLPQPPYSPPDPPGPGFNLNAPIGGTDNPYDDLNGPDAPTSGTVYFGDSGIQLDVNHWLARPQGVYEIEEYREQFAVGGEQVIERTFLVEYGTRHQFLEWVLGYAQSVIQGTAPPGFPPTVILRRAIPDQDPEFPWLYAQHAELVGAKGATGSIPPAYSTIPSAAALTFDTGGGARTYVPKIWYVDNTDYGDQPTHPGEAAAFVGDGAWVNKNGFAAYRVSYKALPYAVRSDLEISTGAFLAGQVLTGPTNAATGAVEPGDFPGSFICPGAGEMERYVTRKFVNSSRSLQVLGGTIQFTSGVPIGSPPGTAPNPGIAGIVIQQNTSLLAPLKEIQFTWHEVPDPPYYAMEQCLMKVNGFIFDGALGFPRYQPGTLLYIGEDIGQTPRTIRGRPTWRITYKMLWNPFTWNAIRAADGNYYPVGVGPAGNPLYFSAPFGSLFVPPPPIFYQWPGQG
jgi:hypothetical protein